MRDIHCHIVPGVDDGSRNMDQSLAMLRAARKAGITQMVCTPHCRGSRFDKELIEHSFDELARFAGGIEMSLGFEVNIENLLDYGLDRARELKFASSDEFLLELSTSVMPANLDRIIYQLQGQGLQVIIAHPERYRYVQEDIDVAWGFVDQGCQLQLSADFIDGGLFSARAKCAKRMLKDGIISHIASDAHYVEDFENLTLAGKKHGNQLQ